MIINPGASTLRGDDAQCTIIEISGTIIIGQAMSLSKQCHDMMVTLLLNNAMA
jgi:hypothetical protein